MKKKILIFDVDGTLAPTSSFHVRAFAQTLQPFGVTVDYGLIAGLDTKHAMEKLLAGASIDLSHSELASLISQKQSIARQLIAAELEPVPEIDFFLKKQKNLLPMALVSSGSRVTVQVTLEKLGYAQWFAPQVCAEDVHMGKPHPEGFLKVLEVTGFQASQALIFEDSSVGFEAAKAAGIDCINMNLDWQKQFMAFIV
ncbi:MAG: HAD-IA family hydrolase [Myxococcota bacterium]